MSFQQTVKGETLDSSGLGDKQHYITFSGPHECFIYLVDNSPCKLTMQLLGGFNSISFIHSDKRVRTACFSKDWALLFCPQGKWKHKAGLSSSHLSST